MTERIGGAFVKTFLARKVMVCQAQMVEGWTLREMVTSRPYI